METFLALGSLCQPCYVRDFLKFVFKYYRCPLDKCYRCPLTYALNKICDGIFSAQQTSSIPIESPNTLYLIHIQVEKADLIKKDTEGPDPTINESQALTYDFLTNCLYILKLNKKMRIFFSQAVFSLSFNSLSLS